MEGKGDRMAGKQLITTHEAVEMLYEITSLQADLIQKLMAALGQFEEFEKELQKINRLKQELEG